MAKSGLVAALVAAAFGLSACGGMTGKPATGVSSSAPNAVSSAASGTTGGGANAFTNQQVTPGSPAGGTGGTGQAGSTTP